MHRPFRYENIPWLTPGAIAPPVRAGIPRSFQCYSPLARCPAICTKKVAGGPLKASFKPAYRRVTGAGDSIMDSLVIREMVLERPPGGRAPPDSSRGRAETTHPERQKRASSGALDQPKRVRASAWRSKSRLSYEFTVQVGLDRFGSSLRSIS